MLSRHRFRIREKSGCSRFSLMSQSARWGKVKNFEFTPNQYFVESPHLHDAIPVLDQRDDLRNERLEPLQEGATAGIVDPQPDDDGRHPTLRVAVDEVLGFRHDDRLVLHGVVPDRRIIGIAQAVVGHVLRGVTESTEKPCQSRRQLGIDHQTHDLAEFEHGVIGLGGGVFQTGGDVLRLEVGVVFEDLRLGNFCGEQVEDFLHPDAHPANAGAPAALVRIEGDTFGHDPTLRQPRQRVKTVLREAESERPVTDRGYPSCRGSHAL